MLGADKALSRRHVMLTCDDIRASVRSFRLRVLGKKPVGVNGTKVYSDSGPVALPKFVEQNRQAVASDLPCNIRREGGQSLVIGGSSLVILEGKACYPL